MRTFRPFALLVPATLVAGSFAFAGQTTASLTIGGPGSYATSGFDDPGRLDDGITVGSGTFDLTFDDGTGVLEVVVTNTSPVFVGIPNPLLTDVYFNTPFQVSGMALLTQVGSGGATPAFTLTFDANNTTPPNPNGTGRFGAFNAALENPQGIMGAIANASADTINAPPGSWVIGPVTFTLQCSGPLAGLTAQDFADAFSHNPPGNLPRNGVAKFQAGGVAGASSFISNPDGEECFLFAGVSNQGESYPSPMSGYPFPLQVGDVGSIYGITLGAPLVVQLPGGPLRRALRTSNGSAGPQAEQRIYLQAAMWNPHDVPWRPLQTSGGLEVRIRSDGTFTIVPFGTADGMTLGHELIELPDGRRFLRFPFTIDGI